MDFRGIFNHGVIRPTEPVTLPEGTVVDCHPVATGNGSTSSGKLPDGFWTSKSIEQLAKEQKTIPTTSIKDLRGDWPPDESIDDFLEFLSKGRQ